METTSRLERISDMCGHHQRLFAYAAADSLDSEFVNLADSFDRYHARCVAGNDGCGR
jgi:hypothetical protein